MTKIRDKQLHVYLPVHLWAALKEVANDDAVSISAFVRALIVKELKKQKQ